MNGFIFDFEIIRVSCYLKLSAQKSNFLTVTTLFYLITERVIMERTISVNFPVYESKISFLAWKVKFEAYVSLLKLSANDAKKLIPLCFSDRKFDSIIETIDDKTTAKSIFERLELIINQENRPSDPLQSLMERKWGNHETFYDYVRELKKRARFITKHAEAVDDLIRLQLIRALPTAMSSVISIQDDIDDIAKRISKLPQTNAQSATKKNILRNFVLVFQK